MKFKFMINNHTWPHSLLFNFFSAGCALDARSADGCDTNSSRGSSYSRFLMRVSFDQFY